MGVLHALLPVTNKIATRSRVRLIVLLVNGNLGDRALAHAEAVIALARALS
jgi:hypothetical protein